MDPRVKPAGDAVLCRDALAYPLFRNPAEMPLIVS
jgi:hypothetical protein